MKASEFVAKLSALIEEHGDVEVWVPDSSCGCCDAGPGSADAPEFAKAGGYDGFGYKIEAPDRFMVFPE